MTTRLKTCLTIAWLVTMIGTINAEQKPNILWINAEDMSPHLGCYGHSSVVTPNIDALARGAIVYRQAFATAPICSPARSCLATGLYATSLGTQHLRCEVKIPSRVVPLARRLSAHGYFCTNTGKSDYNFNPDGIWDVWSNKPAPWRDRQAGQPFFAFMTIGETHEGRINFPDRHQQAVADLPAAAKHEPASIQLPPFYPDTGEMRKIVAGMYDLAKVFDAKVGEVLGWLKEDADFANTIVFIFSDHGNGLPRYKRWLNDSGLRVPLVVYVPPKFRELSPHAAGTETNQLVSFVDFPATAMSLAGLDVPQILQGKPFLGKTTTAPRQFVFGARSRADDMFEVSRSVFDGRYLYVRHFMPHLPYIQRSVIFDDRKSSIRELRRAHRAGEMNQAQAKIWAPRKPPEELYDLQADPHELMNLAGSSDHDRIKQSLAKQLRNWILEHRDSGFLTEAEYQIRAAKAGLTPLDIVQDPHRYDLPATLAAAWRVADPSLDLEECITGLDHQESGVRYWSAIAIYNHLSLHRISKLERKAAENALAARLNDASPSVRIAAATALVPQSQPALVSQALQALDELVQDARPWVSLEAARAIALLGNHAEPIVPTMKCVLKSNLAKPGSPRAYKDFNYASFTGWALETALTECGHIEFIREMK